MTGGRFWVDAAGAVDFGRGLPLMGRAGFGCSALATPAAPASSAGAAALEGRGAAVTTTVAGGEEAADIVGSGGRRVRKMTVTHSPPNRTPRPTPRPI